jgi:hypothetical protein
MIRQRMYERRLMIERQEKSSSKVMHSGPSDSVDIGLTRRFQHRRGILLGNANKALKSDCPKLVSAVTDSRAA